MQSPGTPPSKPPAHAGALAEEGRSAPDETTALIKAEARSQCLPAFLVCDFTANLEKHFGWKLLFLLWTSQHLLKGFTFSLLLKATPYFFRHYKVAAPQVQIFSGVVGLPWAMKPIVGLTSDVAPIFGYHKAPYIIGASICSSFAFMVLSFWTATSISVGVVCLVLVHLQLSTADLLTEARYAVEMQKAPEAGPDLMTYVWAGINMASLLAMLVSGPLISEYGWRAAFFCTSIPAALVLVPIVLGCLEETPRSQEELTAIRRHYLEHRETCFLCLIMLFSTFTIMIVGLVQHDPRINFAVSLVAALFTLLCFSFCLTPVIAKANAFAVLYTGLSASVSGAAFYFYTDTPEMYPAGPHFSDVFFNTVLGTVGTVFSLLGMLIYQRYLGGLPYRMLIKITAVVMFLFSTLDVMMFARLNVKLGIPDHWLVLGLSICEQMVYQWQWMPQVLLNANLCPRGMEATMFALLAGCHNLGTTVSSNFGAALLHVLNVKPRGVAGEEAQFENLWIAAAISSILPLVTAVCLSHLLPDCRQNEKIGAVADPTHNSLLRQWLSR
ncbi:unnamed protein product [Symbiodinium natans]|uniref:Uncharacterized protein n=1 Tax=Symbiodinium natans TaxID=878477 RepID=A0A812LY96_9DINO|nr:unnamed protein product [Symbiodinium natans]